MLDGLFRIVETLFEVRIRPDERAGVAPERALLSASSGPAGDAAPELVGQFYLDLYARAGKRPGAWMDDVRGRWARPERRRCRRRWRTWCATSRRRVGGQPALLTHDDVITLFHEFGHGLHHMLTQVDDLGVSGISGVEWDAVELPSQFMENFCWEWDVLQRLTAHVDTGEPLPRALFDSMLAAKNFQSGLQTLRQVEFALFDMRLHAEPGSETRIAARSLDEVRAEVAVVPPPAFNRFLHSFSHIFAGGYAAGYYSYKWAEVLSADAWSAFEEAARRLRARRRHRAALPAKRSSRSAAAARRWRASRPSAAASRASTRCCATRAWRLTRPRREQLPSRACAGRAWVPLPTRRPSARRSSP